MLHGYPMVKRLCGGLQAFMQQHNFKSISEFKGEQGRKEHTLPAGWLAGWLASRRSYMALLLWGCLRKTWGVCALYTLLPPAEAWIGHRTVMRYLRTPLLPLLPVAPPFDAGHSLQYFTTHTELVRMQRESLESRKKQRVGLAKDDDWSGDGFVKEAESMVAN
jgi:hypothetical protein